MFSGEGNSRRTLSDEGLMDERRQAPSRGRGLIRFFIVGLVVVAVMLVVALVSYIVLSSTPVFEISEIDAQATEHLSATNIAKLASVKKGTTLLTLDEAAITENLKRNPWVGDVQIVREFPDKLKIIVTERTVDSLVKMSTASVCWCLGNDNVWIEPINLTIRDGESADDAALALAREMDALLIIDVPTSLSPTAGESARDEALMAVETYRSEFSKDFSAQIVRFSAASAESIACTLTNGVEVSLGSPVDIDIKEAVIKEILEKHPNQITYINVRVPSQPSYRRLGSESVTEGTGVTVGEQDGASQGAPAADAAASQGTPEAQGQTQAQGGTQTEGADGTAAATQAPADDGSAAVDDTTQTDEGYYDDTVDDGSYDDGYTDDGYTEDVTYDDGSYDEYYDDGSGYYDESYVAEDYGTYDETVEEY